MVYEKKVIQERGHRDILERFLYDAAMVEGKLSMKSKKCKKRAACFYCISKGGNDFQSHTFDRNEFNTLDEALNFIDLIKQKNHSY